MAAALHDVHEALSATFPDVERRGDAVLDDLTHDSRDVRPGRAFCAIVGATTDGHRHAVGAVEAGAAALIVQDFLDFDVPQLRVSDTRQALGHAASVIHNHPSRTLDVVGITGTNGKTTTAYLIEGAFAADGQGTGLIGTIETRIHGAATPGARTTPEASDLQRTLADMSRAGVEAVAMEVSSHGLALHRIDGTHLRVAVFTNLSQDHLDFHQDLEDYLLAKQRLFTQGFAERAVVCVDDEAGRRVATAATIPTVTFGHTHGDVRIVDVVATLEGTSGRLSGGDHDGLCVETRLIGGFNLTNAVGGVLAAVAAGVDPHVAAAGVAAVSRIPGRLERVPGSGASVFVDYAHTPDAVATVIETVRALLSSAARLIVVLGAGGDRDRGKRGPMGAAAAAADVVVVTSDNPRSESPGQIAAAVAAGVTGVNGGGALHVVLDRRVAIARALDVAAAVDDVVLVLGKGHETTQDLGDSVIEFDDRRVVLESRS